MNTIEQRIRDLMNSDKISQEYKNMLANLFPDVLESEDERLRKELIAMVKEDWPGRDDVLAWIEKQGGQKADDFADYKEAIKYVVQHYVIPDEIDDELRAIFKGEWKSPEWSERDERILYGVIETEMYMLNVVNGVKAFDVGNETIRKECEEELTWLKSLKPKSREEWSTKDSKMMNEIILDLKLLKRRDTGAEGKAAYQEEIDWLESIKPNHWKPTEYELEVLKLAAEKDGTCLMGLYEQLKKL